ncbi:uncharacterized protein Ecym_1168 [Eremothecium cymbalariae DBVPG|uniref:Uncharacterized protein n=1 Tax=Eremothecium cymbalariae (strain CBS 270.75 / DBVPG 7215 / KCTC 17166 / NRRL Y-17582) TaxID=931890 RepID=G8JMV4_ERECY|nr:hypothetical protein Ecym_1168 [Eremothecium cymbalariae DBVPG\
MSSFKMKRPHSDPNDITIYKRQKLILDLENLSISDGPLKKVKYCALEPAKESDPSNSLDYQLIPQAIKGQIWDLLRNLDDDDDESASQQQIYRTIWESVYGSNLQLVKWVNWGAYLYNSWFLWYHQKMAMSETTVIASDIEMDTSDSEVDEMEIDMEYED